MALLKAGRLGWNTKGPIAGRLVEIDRNHRLGQGIVCYVAPSTANGLQDISGHQGFLTPNSGPSFTGTPLGPALNFNGTSQYVSGSDAALPSGSADRTISVWFSTSTTTGAKAMFAYGTAGTTNYVMGYINATSLIVGNSTNYATSSVTTTDGKLHHLVAVLTGPSTWTAMLDGVAITGGTATPTTTLSGATGLRLGNYLTNIDWFPGTIDNFIVYNRALSADEQRQLYFEPFAALKPVARRRLSVPPSSIDASVTAGTGSLAFTGFAPSVSADASATPGVGSLALTGFSPSITATATVTPGTASLTLSGLAPAVSADASATPGTGTLTFSGFAPAASASVSVTPGAGAFTLSGFAPSASADASVIPGTGALSLVGYAPTLSGVSASATPGTALLSFVGYAPTVITDGWVLADATPTSGPWSLGDTLTQPLLLNGEPLLVNGEPLEIDGGSQDWARGDGAASAIWAPAP